MEAFEQAQEALVGAGVTAAYAPFAVVVLTLVVMAIVVQVIGIVTGGSGSGSGSGSGGSGRTGNATMFIGNCGAGKTALFYKLYADEMPDCVTSIEAKEKKFKIALEDGGTLAEKEIEFIDFPGHARLRGQLLSYVKRCKTIVVVVDGTDTSRTKLCDMADLFYDVLCECVRSNCEPNILVALNKSDLPKCQKPEELKKLLEKEMDSLKTTRHSLETEGEEDLETILGQDGVPFEFDNDAGCDVSFESISVKDAKLDPLLEFLEEAYS